MVQNLKNDISIIEYKILSAKSRLKKCHLSALLQDKMKDVFSFRDTDGQITFLNLLHKISQEKQMCAWRIMELSSLSHMLCSNLLLNCILRDSVLVKLTYGAQQIISELHINEMSFWMLIGRCHVPAVLHYTI